MARAARENLIDQPSEEVIDLADAKIADEAIAEFTEAREAEESAPRRGGVLRIFTGLPFLLAGMVISMIFTVGLLYVNTQRSEREARYIEQSSQLLMLSQRMAKEAREAVLGQPESFKTLKDSRDRFAQIVTSLRDGNPTLGIPPSPLEIREDRDGKESPLNAVLNIWAPKQDREGMQREVDQSLSQEKALAQMRENVQTINQTSPLLLTLADEIAEAGAEAGMKQNDLYILSRHAMLSQRIAKDVTIFAQG